MLNFRHTIPEIQRNEMILALGIPLQGVTYSEIIVQIENYLLEEYENSILPDAHPHSAKQAETFTNWADKRASVREKFMVITGFDYPFLNHIS